ncbi:MAG: DUF4383 domain-containing protein [Micromonosporaceae bacterium]|nr:DUF4383 domain-containing protein [Micromonosporaceae bacterium]
MVHLPINHPLQPFYRLLAGLTGAYVLAFGIAGVLRSGGRPFFAQENLPYVLGLHANRAFAILSIVVGAFLLASVVIGGDVHRWVALVSSVVFLVSGLVMLVLERTDFNFLGFTPITSIVSFIIGLVLLIAGLYGKVGTMLDVRREEEFRHGSGPDPTAHRLSTPNPPHDWREEPHDWRRDRKERHERERAAEHLARRQAHGVRSDPGVTGGQEQVGTTGNYE